MQRAIQFQENLACEEPYFQPDDRIGFNRSQISCVTHIDGNGKKATLLGPANIIPDYETMLTKGMEQVKEEVTEKLSSCDEDQKEYYKAVLLTIDAALDLAERYREAAKKAGKEEVYQALCRVPRKGAQTLHEAWGKCILWSNEIVVYSVDFFSMRYLSGVVPTYSLNTRLNVRSVS